MSAPKTAEQPLEPPSTGGLVQGELPDGRASPSAAIGFGQLAVVALLLTGEAGFVVAPVTLGVLVAVVDVWLIARLREGSPRSVGPPAPTGALARLAARARRPALVDGSRDRDWRRTLLVALAMSVLPVLTLLLGDRLRLGGEDGLDWPWQAIVMTLAVLTCSLHLSSLIDWAYVNPAMRGGPDHRLLPCRTSTHQRWRTVTKVWLAHRIVVFVLLRLSPVALVTFAVALFHPSLAQPTGGVVGAVGGALLVLFINRFAPLITLVTNPPFQVGDQVVLAEEYGTGVDERPVYYVVSVAIEGIDLLQLGEDGLPLGARRRTHDRSLALVDAPRLLRRRDAFGRCEHICCMANRYCPVGVGGRPPALPATKPPADRTSS